MKLTILEETKDSLKIEVDGETISFVNAIREELWNDPNVDEAAYIREHPYLEKPKIWVKVKKGSPKKALLDAVKRLQNRTKELKSLVEKLK